MEVQILSPAHASPCPKRFAKRCSRVSRSTQKNTDPVWVGTFSLKCYSRDLRGSVSGTSAIMNPETSSMSAIAKNALTAKSTVAGI